MHHRLAKTTSAPATKIRQWLLLLALCLPMVTVVSHAEDCPQREELLKYLALDQTFDEWLQGCIGRDFENLNEEQAKTACDCIVDNSMSTIRRHVKELASGTLVCGSNMEKIFSADAKTAVTEQCLTQFNKNQ